MSEDVDTMCNICGKDCSELYAEFVVDHTAEKGTRPTGKQWCKRCFITHAYDKGITIQIDDIG